MASTCFSPLAILASVWKKWFPTLCEFPIGSYVVSQNVPKFELYKHNDELFNTYYRIFYELWTFADFDWLCKLEKRGDEIKKKSSPLKLLSQSQPNFDEMSQNRQKFKVHKKSCNMC
jgi:hypothetical protein